mmetsp:Transcript_33223/g.65788  ORF Transcript_33223/g.65788 Transcript_33223/m.65788 type:complete len:109 (+) Transcript_33223:330-656(+)
MRFRQQKLRGPIPEPGAPRPLRAQSVLGPPSGGGVHGTICLFRLPMRHGNLLSPPGTPARSFEEPVPSFISFRTEDICENLFSINMVRMLTKGFTILCCAFREINMLC